MKKVWVIAIGIVAFAGAIVLLFRFDVKSVIFSSSQESNFLSENNEEIQGNELQNQNFLVTPLREAVLLKDARESDFFEITAEQPAQNGAVVHTSETGRALIESSDDTVTAVDRNASFTIISADAGATSIQLHSGDLWARVQKLFDKGEFYEIETQNAVASVHGTSFGVSYYPFTTAVMVTEGEVIVFSIDPETRERLLESKTVVSAGEKAEIGQDGTVTITPISESEKRTEWYEFNNPSKESNEPDALLEPRVKSGEHSSVAPATEDSAAAPSTEDTTKTEEPAPLPTDASAAPVEPTPPPPPETTAPSETIDSGTTASVPETSEPLVPEQPAVHIAGIKPTTVELDHNNPVRIIIVGEGFTGADAVMVGTQSMLEFVVLDDTMIEFSSIELSDAGIFDITVRAETSSDTLMRALQLTVPPSDPIIEAPQLKLLVPQDTTRTPDAGTIQEPTPNILNTSPYSTLIR